MISKFTVNEMNTLFPKTKTTSSSEAENIKYWKYATMEALSGNNRPLNELMKIQDEAPPEILEIIGEMGIYHKVIKKVKNFNDVYGECGFYWLIAGENFELMKVFIECGFRSKLLIDQARKIAVINKDIDFLTFLNKYGL